MTISVIIADDQPLIRSALAMLIGSDPELNLVGTASNGTEALALIREQHPDVALMDIQMPQTNGIDVVRTIADSSDLASTRIVMLTTYDTEENIIAALQAGASGFLLKDATPAAILNAIHTAHRGDSLLDSSVTRRLVTAWTPTKSDAHRLDVLTDREREVLEAVARGLTNPEIADELNITLATTKTHISRILAKLDARDRVQLVIFAYKTGLRS